MADLLLIEHASQASAATTVPRGTRVVALSPEAMNALDCAGVAYRTPHDYFSTPELIARGASTYDAVLDYCRRLDAWLEAEWPELARVAIHPATLCQYDFKILSDTLSLRAEEVRAILQAERPDRVYAFPTEVDTLDVTLAYRRESAYTRVLPIAAAEAGVTVEWSTQSTTPIRARKENHRLRDLVPSHWKQRLAHFRRSGAPVWRDRAPRSESDVVLLLNLTPDIRSLINHEAAPFRFVHWPGTGLPFTLRPLSGRDLKTLRSSLASPIPTSVATGGKVPTAGLVSATLEPLVHSRVLHFARAAIPPMIEAARRAEQVVEYYAPLAAVAGILGSPEVRAAAARVRQLGVPLVLYQHGGSYGYLDHPIHYHNDLYHADYFLTYGEGVSKYLREQYGRRTPRADLRSVGSAVLAHSLDRVAKRRPASSPARKPVVLYVATVLTGQRFYAPHYRSCEYFALLKEAAAALDGASGVDAILKIHQRGDNCLNPIDDWCRRHAPRVRVVVDGTLDRLFDQADLVVIDLPSTPLLEALARQIPTLAFCDERVFRINPAARPLLEAAVRLETDRDRFLAAIRRGADLVREAASDAYSEEFLHQFGTRRSAARDAIEALAAICRPRAAVMMTS